MLTWSVTNGTVKHICDYYSVGSAGAAFRTRANGGDKTCAGPLRCGGKMDWWQERGREGRGWNRGAGFVPGRGGIS